MISQAKPDAQKNSPAKKPAAKKDRVKMLTYITTAACALALGAVVFSTVTVTGAQNELALVRADSVPVVVANAPISAGATIAAESVKVIDVPKTYLSADAVSDASQAVGKVAASNIPANGQLTASLVAGSEGAASLALALKPGYVATSVSVDAQTGVAGLLHQGDFVDVIAEGAPVVEKIRVLALDASLNENKGEYATVTVELTVEQAGMIQQAQVDSDVRFILHSQADRAVA